ncbi:MAG: hypothetical protein WC584_03745 [Candidatus Pacearchaeota archaeon]
MNKTIIKIGKRTYKDTSNALEWIVIGGLVAGMSFYLFENYPGRTLLGVIILIFIVFILGLFFKDKKRCPHCKKIMED